MKIAKFFEYLSLLHLDTKQEKITDAFQACKNESMLQSTNRVYFRNRITAEDIQTLKQFYANRPFTIWLNKNNSAGNADAEQLKLEKRYSFPLMLATLKNIDLAWEHPLINVHQITSKDSILNLWSHLVSAAYNISLSEFKKFVTYLLSVNKFECLKFYIGYFNDTPAATSLFIERDDLVDIHWVGTIKEFRNRGLGRAITVFPLQEAKSTNIIHDAILYASAMGKPLYEKMGFTEVGECSVYAHS